MCLLWTCCTLYLLQWLYVPEGIISWELWLGYLKYFIPPTTTAHHGLSFLGRLNGFRVFCEFLRIVVNCRPSTIDCVVTTIAMALSPIFQISQCLNVSCLSATRVVLLHFTNCGTYTLRTRESYHITKYSVQYLLHTSESVLPPTNCLL